MDIETKRYKLEEIFSHVLMTNASKEQIIEAILRLDTLTEEEITLAEVEKEASEKAELETKLAEAQAVIAEVTPLLEALNVVKK